jgi:hypothetical protein
MTPDSWLRNDGMSIYEIAKLLGITPRRVQQIEASALRKLRRFHPRLLRQFIGINSHLGDEYEVTIGSASCAHVTHFSNTPAIPGAKEGPHR